jgi:hypothetical protein
MVKLMVITNMNYVYTKKNTTLEGDVELHGLRTRGLVCVRCARGLQLFSLLRSLICSARSA